MKGFVVLGISVLVALSSRAESRAPGSFYTPDKLAGMSTLVFTGTVVEVETNAEYKVAFPTKATVDGVLKGKLDKRELTFQHKNPGRCIILEQEYNTPEVGQTGTFYLEDQGGTLVLIGYIRKTESGRR